MNQQHPHLSPEHAQALARAQALQQQYLQQAGYGQMPGAQPAQPQPNAPQSNVPTMPAAVPGQPTMGQPNMAAHPTSPSMQDEAGRFALGAVADVTGFSRLSGAKGLLSAGLLMLLAGLYLAFRNVQNSLGLITSGEPFWDSYFLVENSTHAIQAYGSIVLPILGVVLLVIAAVRRR